jgi:hypothetical protein
MFENPLDHIALASFDEADELHLSATTKVCQRIYVLGPLDEPVAGRNGAGSRTSGGRLLRSKRRVIKRKHFCGKLRTSIAAAKLLSVDSSTCSSRSVVVQEVGQPAPRTQCPVV